ncbi:MAG: endonuclease III [Candidatus Thermoplasmatota archaeon]
MPRETKADKARRALRIVAALESAYPESTCALDHASPFQLLVATALSAQTTDIAVNKATRTLFKRWPTPVALAAAPLREVERTIDSIGLWRAKAKNIRALSGLLVEEFAGEVPRTIEELTTLPGVGRKTATAVLGTAFGIRAGVTVDTHMVRINAFLGLSKGTNPETIAAALEQLLPPESWTAYTHRVIDHGRLVCVARRPRCGVCPLATLCPSARSAKVGYKEENDAKEPASAKGLSWRARSL